MHILVSFILMAACQEAGEKKDAEVRTQPLRKLECYHYPPNRLALSKDGTILAVGGWMGEVSIWDTTSWQQIRTLGGKDRDDLRGGGLRAIAPDGSEVARVNRNTGNLELWNINTEEIRRTPIKNGYGHNPLNSVLRAAFSPDGKMLVGVNPGTFRVKVWDAKNFESCWEIDCSYYSYQGAQTVAFSPDGRMLAVGFFNGHVVVADTTTKQVIATLESRDKAVTALAFSPDGRTLATASDWGAPIRLWDTATFKPVRSFGLEGPRAEAFVLAFSPRGERLAIGTTGGTTAIIDPTSGQRTLSLVGDKKTNVRDIVYLPDGKTLVTVANGTPVRVAVWDVSERTSALSAERQVITAGP